MTKKVLSITDKPLEVKRTNLIPDREELRKKVLEKSSKLYKKKKGLKKSSKLYKKKKEDRVLIKKIKTNVMRGYNFLFPEGNEEINQIINQRFGA